MFTLEQHFLSSFTVDWLKDPDQRKSQLLVDVVMEVDWEIMLKNPSRILSKITNSLTFGTLDDDERDSFTSDWSRY